MVALAVWLTALLALAGAQGRSLQHAREAELRGRIDAAVENLASAIQARPDSHWVHYVEAGYADHASPQDCPAQCDPAQRAAADLSRFKQSLRRSGGMAERISGAVCRGDVKKLPTAASPGCGGSGPLAIRVAWRSRQGRGWQEHADVWPLLP
ncbi:hypothetical protein C2I19_09615 [Chromobacterium alticapitis]|uniref:DUF4440 domain-containing protein n=2 Tax=Chromobacterium alticapitis TaxID=2073169 RepID=A0A2S5DGP6_9NEIS|nr:hypothetical protein C2I19_09615 [Chromobacterium alticapitis]